METEFKVLCQDARAKIEALKQEVKALQTHGDFKKPCGESDHGEMRANVQLVYRHLEDARMRLGKAIQASDGGKSCYPK